jgi:hypothetical protein
MMKRRGGLRKRALLLFGLGLLLLFSVRAALPQVVICHRAGGGSAVEFDADGGCLCDECEHCRARLSAPHGAPSGPAWEPCHCRHEAFSADDGAAALRLPDRPILTGASPFPAAEISAPPVPLRLLLLLSGPAGLSTGPPGSAGPLLRC